MSFHRRPSKSVVLFLALLLTSSVALVFGAVVVVPSVRTTIRQAGTLNRLQHIQLAMMCYHQINGCYPPQYLAGQHGKPAHSWRVLLLPYMGHEQLFRRYCFDEPWDGPHNRVLAREMPAEYRSPFVDSKSTITQYVGIAGNDTPWRGTTPLHERDMQRSESNPLIWFVEAANSDINWMEPRDIPLEQALAGINVPGRAGLQSNYSHGLPAQMKPFGYQWVSPNTSTENLRAMLTITGSGD